MSDSTKDLEEFGLLSLPPLVSGPVTGDHYLEVNNAELLKSSEEIDVYWWLVKVLRRGTPVLGEVKLMMPTGYPWRELSSISLHRRPTSSELAVMARELVDRAQCNSDSYGAGLHYQINVMRSEPPSVSQVNCMRFELEPRP